MQTAEIAVVARWRRAGLATRAAVVGAAAVALVATVFVAALLAVNALGSASAAESRSSRVIDRATQMGEDFLDLHDGVRGFALTDQRSFLAPFWRGVSNLPGDVQAVRTLVKDNPSQLALLAKLAAASESYIVSYAMPFIAHPTLADRDRAR